MAELIIKKTVLVNRTADEWELYADNPGAEESAAEMSKAVEDAINSSDGWSEAYGKIWPAFDKHAELGACDSEPLWHLDNILNKVYSKDF